MICSRWKKIVFKWFCGQARIVSDFNWKVCKSHYNFVTWKLRQLNGRPSSDDEWSTAQLSTKLTISNTFFPARFSLVNVQWVRSRYCSHANERMDFNYFRKNDTTLFWLGLRVDDGCPVEETSISDVYIVCVAWTVEFSVCISWYVVGSQSLRSS